MRTFASIPSQGGNIYLMLWDKQGMLEQGMAEMPERARRLSALRSLAHRDAPQAHRLPPLPPLQADTERHRGAVPRVKTAILLNVIVLHAREAPLRGLGVSARSLRSRRRDTLRRWGHTNNCDSRPRRWTQGNIPGSR